MSTTSEASRTRRRTPGHRSTERCSPPLASGARLQRCMIARIALRFTAWAERWLPDAFVFALLATLVVLGLGLVAGHASPVALVDAWGKGFWELLPFTMQMALVIVTGYVLASSRPVALGIARLARVPP